MNDIYGSLKKKRVRKSKPIAPLEKVERSMVVPIELKVPMPDVQKVELTNQELPEPITFPDVQKVEVTNPPEIPKVEFPDVQKVQIENLPEPTKVEFPDVQKVEVTNPTKLELPDVQKVTVTNPTPQLDIPIGKGNTPGQADPERYVPVRLTNGKKFYNALEEAFVSGGKAVFPYVDQNGKPKQVQLDANGNIPTTASVSVGSVSVSNFPTTQGITTAVSGSLTTTTASGQPGLNFPTVQTVNVQNLPYVQVQPGVTTAVSGSLSLTTTSGSPLNSSVVNFPTVSTVNVQNIPPVSVSNFPTTQQVQVTPGVTTAISGVVTSVSGTQHAVVDNFPTVQTVAVQSMPEITANIDVKGVTLAVSGTVTTISGSKTDIQNFPTVQTVAVQSMPTITAQLTADGVTTAISGTVTTISGSKTDIQNFPTVQTVNVQNMPNVTTASGSKVDVSNFPTYQTVNVQNMPNVTTASGSQMDIKNFPTYQTVNVQNMPAITGSVTTNSGSQVDVKNFPTYQGVRLFDPGGNYLGIPTSPLTVSGVVDIQANTPTMVSGVGTAVQQIKATACVLDSYYIYNPNATVTYLQLFDVAAATAVTLGTTVPKQSYGIPATAAANLSTLALQFQNGLKIAATTTAGGSTGPATGMDVSLGFK